MLGNLGPVGARNAGSPATRTETGTYLVDVVLVWVVLWRHQQQDETLCQLDPIQGHHTHVEEDTKQNRQGNLAQNLSDDDGQTWQSRDIQNPPGTKVTPVLLPGCCLTH